MTEDIEQNDRVLIEKWTSGDDSAFSDLMRKYIKSIYNFLYSLTGDKSAIDDLTQETFIKVWKNIHRFDRNKSFKVWLFAIAKNTALDYFKKKKVLSFSLFTDEEGNNMLENIKEETPLPDEILERQDFVQELEKKLEKIPALYRVILLMRYKEDFSLPEIARILGKPYSTIKSQHNRALEKLKNAFL